MEPGLWQHEDQEKNLAAWEDCITRKKGAGGKTESLRSLGLLNWEHAQGAKGGGKEVMLLRFELAGSKKGPVTVQ